MHHRRYGPEKTAGNVAEHLAGDAVGFFLQRRRRRQGFGVLVLVCLLMIFIYTPITFHNYIYSSVEFVILED